MNKPPSRHDSNDGSKRRLLHSNPFRWAELFFQIWWVFACLSAVFFGVASLLSDDQPFDDYVYVMVIVFGVIALPVAPIVIWRIHATVDKIRTDDNADESDKPESSGEHPTKEEEPSILSDRIIPGIAGLIFAGAGLYAGLHGKLYYGRHDNSGNDAPVLSWVLGGLLVLIGLHFVYGAIFGHRSPDKSTRR